MKKLWPLLAGVLFGVPFAAFAQGSDVSPAVALDVADAESSGAPPQSPRITRRGTERGDIELGFGASYFWFRASPFNSNTFGTNTNFTYFLAPSRALEGDVSTGFGSRTTSMLYGAGFRVILPRYEHWRPWAHVVFGGIHMFPQAATGNNGVMAEFGGGTDWRLKPWLWLRMEGNYVRSQLYSQGQNNFQVASSVVYRF